MVSIICIQGCFVTFFGDVTNNFKRAWCMMNFPLTIFVEWLEFNIMPGLAAFFATVTSFMHQFVRLPIGDLLKIPPSVSLFNFCLTCSF